LGRDRLVSDKACQNGINGTIFIEIAAIHIDKVLSDSFQLGDFGPKVSPAIKSRSHLLHISLRRELPHHQKVDLLKKLMLFSIF